MAFLHQKVHSLSPMIILYSYYTLCDMSIITKQQLLQKTKIPPTPMSNIREKPLKVELVRCLLGGHMIKEAAAFKGRGCNKSLH